MKGTEFGHEGTMETGTERGEKRKQAIGGG